MSRAVQLPPPARGNHFLTTPGRAIVTRIPRSTAPINDASRRTRESRRPRERVWKTRGGGVPDVGACPHRSGENIGDANPRPVSRSFFAADHRSRAMECNAPCVPIARAGNFFARQGVCRSAAVRVGTAPYSEIVKDLRPGSGKASVGSPQVSGGLRERTPAQSPGKSYRTTDDFACWSESGVCAEWEAGFRLTGNRKPVMDGVSGLFPAVTLPSLDSHDRHRPRGPQPRPRGGPSVPWRNRRPCCTSLATSAART